MNPDIRLAVALDGLPRVKKLNLITTLRDNPNIIIKEQPDSYDLLKQAELGPQLFYDVKLKDIKSTVLRLFRKIMSDLAPGYITVHAGLSTDTLQALLIEAEKYSHAFGYPVRIIAVTLLTNIGKEDCKAMYGVLPKTQTMRWARHAHKAGVRHFVCSVQEVAAIKHAFPETICYTPGISSAKRLSTKGNPTQQRTGSLAQALASGSNVPVIATLVVSAENPHQAVNGILWEMDEHSR